MMELTNGQAQSQQNALILGKENKRKPIGKSKTENQARSYSPQPGPNSRCLRLYFQRTQPLENYPHSAEKLNLTITSLQSYNRNN